jgi:PKHD-type hydroxylase
MMNWQLWSGELSPDFTSDIIENLSKLPEVEGSTFNGDTSYRSSVIRWVHGERDLKDLLFQYFRRANAEAFGFDLGYITEIEMQFTEYDAEYAGQYKVHHDIDWTSAKPYQRKLSMVIQLSDPADYEGGELQFTEVENPVRDDLRKQGSIIVFPSYLQHAVTPVIKGKRYSLVLWLSGPRWK